MTTFIVKQKLFSLHEIIRGADGKLQLGKMLENGAAGGGSVESAIANTSRAAANEAAAAAKQATHQATSQALKPMQGKINQIAGSARTQGFQKGLNSATLNKQVLSNTWKSMPKTGKVGAVAGAVALGALALKGLMSGKKKEE